MLKDYIHKNRNAFESDEPQSGHEDRFRKRLESYNNRKRKRFNPFVEYAAVALIILSIGAIVMLKTGNTENNTFSFKDIDKQEFKEVQYYYQNEIEHQYATLINNCQPGNEELISDIELSIAQLDSDYEQLEVERETNPNDERIKNAMIQVYQQKLEILKLVIEKTCIIN